MSPAVLISDDVTSPLVEPERDDTSVPVDAEAAVTTFVCPDDDCPLSTVEVAVTGVSAAPVLSVEIGASTESVVCVASRVTAALATVTLSSSDDVVSSAVPATPLIVAVLAETVADSLAEDVLVVSSLDTTDVLNAESSPAVVSSAADTGLGAADDVFAPPSVVADDVVVVDGASAPTSDATVVALLDSEDCFSEVEDEGVSTISNVLDFSLVVSGLETAAERVASVVDEVTIPPVRV